MRFGDLNESVGGEEVEDDIEERGDEVEVGSGDEAEEGEEEGSLCG